MSDGVSASAPAPESSAPASTEAEQGTTVDNGEGPLSTRDAVKFMTERRKARAAEERLRLVPDDGADLDEPTSDDADGATLPEGEETADDGEAEPEKVPTWAQKLKADVEKKTALLADLEKTGADREAKFAEAHRTVQFAVEDIKADLAEEQGYSAMLEKAIADAGLRIPPDWKRALLAERKSKMLERHLARGTQAEQGKGVEKAGQQAIGSLEALRKELPELDWEKVPEARAWLQSRFAIGEDGKPVFPGAMKTLKDDAVAFAKALRWDRAQKANAGKPGAQKRPGEAQRPRATTLNGAQQNAGAKRVPAVPQNEKESLAWLQARRSQRK